jgi:hypothetical protein
VALGRFEVSQFKIYWLIDASASYIVAQNGAQIVEVAFFVGHGDQPPVAVSRGIFFTKIGAACPSACRDEGAILITTPTSATTATSTKTIRLIGCLLQTCGN